MQSPPQDYPDSQERSADIDLVSVIDTVLGQFRAILAITLAATAVGVGWAFLCHPGYQADILIQVQDSPAESAASNLLGDVSALFDVKSSAAAEAQVVTSRLVVTEAVDALRLYIDARPKRFPVVGDFISRFNDGLPQPGVAGIGGYCWGRETVEIERFDVPRDFIGDRFTLTMDSASDYTLRGSDLDRPLHGRLGTPATVPTARGPVVFNVARFNALPGARFTVVRNSRIETIGRLQQKLDVSERVKQSGVIVATLVGDDPDRVSRTLREVANQYVRQNVERKYADAAHSLAFLTGQLPSLKKTLDDSQQRYTQMRNAHGSVDLPEEARLGLQQMADTKAQMVALRQKRADLLTRYTDDFPAVTAIDSQLRLLEKQLDSTGEVLRRLPDVEQEAARLMLDIKVNTDLYTATLNNVRQLQLVKAGRVGSVRLIDDPVVPETVAWPNRPLVIVASVVAGLLLGIVYAFTREALFGGVNTAAEIERATHLPVLAAIPQSRYQTRTSRQLERTASGRVQLLAALAPDDQAVESLRSLRTALQFVAVEGERNVVVMTGPSPGVGKSFVAANLAAIMAAAGQRVLLVDADLRRGYLNRYFDAARAPGLADLLTGKAALGQAMHAACQPGLDLIPAGGAVLNPAELLLSDKLPTLIDSLHRRYDFVFIDAPPVLAVEDAALVAAHASMALLVARAGTTRAGDLVESAKRLQRGGVRTAGVVLNGLPARSARYAYGSKHGGYRYTNYDYGAEKKQAGWLTRCGGAFAARWKARR